MRVNAKFLIMAVLATTSVAFSADKTPFERTKSFKTCADLLIKLAGDLTKNAKLDELKIHPSSVPQGGAFIAANGAVVLRSADAENKADFNVVSPAESAKALTDFINNSALRGNYVVIAGQMPLDRLFKYVQSLNLGKASRFVYFSVEPSGEAAVAKRQLLEKQFSTVEIVIDLDLPSAKVQEALRTLVTGKVLPEKSLRHVQFVSARDLPGKGTLAERLLSNPPAKDALRFTITHQRGGKAILSDNSTIKVSDLTNRRIANGDMDVFAGCNLRPTERHEWLLIDGELLGREVFGLAADVSARFDKKQKLTGAEILEEVSRFADPPGGSGPPGSGGNDPPGGRENPGDGPQASSQSGKSGRTFLRLLEIALISFAVLADDDDDDDDKNGGSCAPHCGEEAKAGDGGTVAGELTSGAAVVSIAGIGDWIESPQAAARLAQAVWPTVADRPVIYIDTERNRLHLFAPTRGTRNSIGRPLASMKITDKPDEKTRAILAEQATRFWFYAGDEVHAVKSREQLQKWQTATGINFPFIFIPIQKASSESWTLLTPFLQECSIAGECLPRTQAEANEMGLFWCNQHQTAMKMKQYTELAAVLETDKTRTIDMRAETKALQVQLKNLLADENCTAWLTGVWQDGKLRRKDGDINNNTWVERDHCGGRIAFVSAYPVSAPPKNRFFETVADPEMPTMLKIISTAAKENKRYPQIKEELTKFHDLINRHSGLIAVSSCGKYLLISE